MARFDWGLSKPAQETRETGRVEAIDQYKDRACLGRHRVNIGGTVIVTASGCEELNHILTGMIITGVPRNGD